MGIPYRSKTFVITRALHRHDIKFDNIYDSDGYFQLSFAPLWLKSIGTRFSMLHKVMIDMDATCDAQCDQRAESLDILPLLRIMWKTPNAVDIVELAHTGRHWISEPGHPSPNVDRMNNILDSLDPMDAHGLKKYIHTVSWLESINISPWEGDGNVA